MLHRNDPAKLMELTKQATAIALLVGPALILCSLQAWANGDSRTFDVYVDGKSCGFYRIVFVTDRTGAETITAVADIKVPLYFREYRFSYQCLEKWRKGSLDTLEATTNDNGKKSNVKAQATDQGLLVTVAGKSRASPTNLLTSNGCLLPIPVSKAMEATLLDTEDGSESLTTIEPYGPCTVRVNGRTLSGQRYRVTGKNIDTEWWFDRQNRPIRQMMVWDGHQVILELITVAP